MTTTLRTVSEHVANRAPSSLGLATNWAATPKNADYVTIGF